MDMIKKFEPLDEKIIVPYQGPSASSFEGGSGGLARPKLRAFFTSGVSSTPRPPPRRPRRACFARPSYDSDGFTDESRANRIRRVPKRREQRGNEIRSLDVECYYVIHMFIAEIHSQI
jgi:hypothetical protein